MPLLLRGWGQPEQQRGHGWVWAIGRRSAIRLTLLKPRDLTAVFRCWPFRFRGAPTQQLTISVNGAEVGSIDLQDGSKVYRVPIPGERFVVGDNEISFDYRYARRPFEVDSQSRDARLLAVAWESLRLEGPALGQPHLQSDNGKTAVIMPFSTRAVYRGKIPPQSELVWEELGPWPANADPAGARLEVHVEGDGLDERFAIPVKGPSKSGRVVLPHSSSEVDLSLEAIPSSTVAPGAGLRVSGLRLNTRIPPGGRHGAKPAPAVSAEVTNDTSYGVRYVDVPANMQVGLRYRMTATLDYAQPTETELQDVRLHYAWFPGQGEEILSQGTTSVAQELCCGEPATISSLIVAPERPGTFRLRVWLDVPAATSIGRRMERTVVVEPLAEGEPSDSAGRIRIVGLDGATWALLVPWAQEGKLPNLARILKEGAWGPIEAFTPTLSPVIWTSIATGKRPEKHGIEGFQTRDSGSTSFRPVRSSDRKAAPFWSVASRYDRTVAVMNWMVTAPAEPVNGVMLSRLREMTEQVVYPPSLASEISAVLEKVDPKNTEPMPVQNKWLELLRGDLRRLIAAQQYLQTRDAVDVAAFYTHSTDEIQHRFWKYLEPELFSDFCPPPSEKETERYGDVILEHYQQVDRWIGRMRRESDILILVSDHGAIADSQPRIYLQANSLLARLGYAQLDAGKLDAVRSRAFDCTINPWDYELSICLNLKGREQSGLIDPDEKLEVLRNLQTELADLELSDGTRLFRSVQISTEQGVDLRAMPKPMTCADLDREVVLQHRRIPMRELVETHDVSGTHTRYGIIAMVGNPIRPGPIRAATVFDVAPTILYLLGLPLADDLDGKPLTDAIEEDFLLRHPVTRVTSYNQSSTPSALDSAAGTLDESTRERLRSLGYIQ